MESFLEGSASFLIAILLGLSVRGFLECAIPIKRPDHIVDDDWHAITDRVHAGKWIGFFERLLFVFALLVGDAGYVITAWLAFKVAAKWEAWSNIVKVPSNLGKYSDLVWYSARRHIGSWILSRFLVGTLVNILISALAVYIGSNCFEFGRLFLAVVSNAP